MSSKVDYSYKSYVLQEHNDLLLQQRKASLIDYLENEFIANGVIPSFLGNYKGVLNSTELYHYCLKNNLLKELKECYKINRASFYRTKRLKERIETMLLNGDCIFLTLTFDNDTLNTTDAKQRRIMVSRYLKLFDAPYVANIDFGKLNKREHYHAVINTANIDYSLWRKYGNINGEKIRNKDIKSDKTKLAKYICKLSNHAIKETTKRSALIYSR